MRTTTTVALALFAAIAASPALAASTIASSWEASATEMQKQGPTSNLYGPYRNGTYVVTNGHNTNGYYSSYRDERYNRHYSGSWN